MEIYMPFGDSPASKEGLNVNDAAVFETLGTNGTSEKTCPFCESAITWVEDEQARPRCICSSGECDPEEITNYFRYMGKLPVRPFDTQTSSDESSTADLVDSGPNAMLTVALDYSVRGFSVLPLWGVDDDGACGCGNADCKNAGKHPIGRLVPNGDLDATTDSETIRGWFASAPEANIGIALGPSELFVIAPDAPEWDVEFHKRGLPRTPTVQSGGGEGHLHYYFHRPEKCPIRRLCRSSEFDIMSGGSVVAPPSKHRSGRHYELVVGFDEPIADAPDWAVELLEAGQAAAQDFAPIDPNEPPVRLNGKALERWHGTASVHKSNGQVYRSGTLMQIGRDLAAARATRKGIIDALRDRDGALWSEPKYAERTDAEKRYAEIADRALHPATVPDVTDVTVVTRFAQWEEGYLVLDAVESFLRAYVIYPSIHALVAHVLWIAHTHLMNSFESTPRLAALSPEPASGKTRALEASELLVPHPVEAVNVSAAYLFRKVDDPAGLPTILFDEIDTIFGAKARDNEDLRGLINAGHRKGAVAGRCVVQGRSVVTVEYSAYCAIAMAGLGELPETLLTRSVVLRMRRRAMHEKVKPFRRRVALPVGHVLRDRLASWATQIEGELEDKWPEMPVGVEDRDADVWEPLLMVADAAGGDWPARARAAAVALVQESKESTPSLNVRLLGDLRTVFGQKDQLHAETIVQALYALEEAPWIDLVGGKALTTRGLSKRLSGYGVKSVPIRIGEKVARGYTREALTDAWERYLPPIHREDAGQGEQPGVAQQTEPGPSDSPPAELLTAVTAVATDGQAPPGLNEREPQFTRTCIDCGSVVPNYFPGHYCERHGGMPMPEDQESVRLLG
jgi:hypothetical protein